VSVWILNKAVLQQYDLSYDYGDRCYAPARCLAGSSISGGTPTVAQVRSSANRDWQCRSNTKTATALLEADIRQTNLLKHPGVVRIIEPLEETRTQYVLVTEEVIGSLDSWLKGSCRLQVEVCFWHVISRSSVVRAATGSRCTCCAARRRRAIVRA
jgi:hypothetical protein